MSLKMLKAAHPPSWLRHAFIQRQSGPLKWTPFLSMDVELACCWSPPSMSLVNKIPSEMVVAPHYKLLTLLHWQCNTVDTAYNIETALHCKTFACLPNPTYIVRKGWYAIGMGCCTFEQKVGWMDGWWSGVEWIPLRLLWLQEHLQC